MSYGAPFCRGIEPFLANLKTLLAEATRLGLNDGTWPAVVSAQAVYDDVNGMLIYVPFLGSDCERNTKEVQDAITSLTAVLAAIPSASLIVPRPDAKPPEPYGIPTWVKYVAIAGVTVYGLSMLKGFLPTSGRRMAGYRRRKR